MLLAGPYYFRGKFTVHNCLSLLPAVAGGGRAGWGRENASGSFLNVIIQGLDNAPNQPLSPSVIEFLQ